MCKIKEIKWENCFNQEIKNNKKLYFNVHTVGDNKDNYNILDIWNVYYIK